MGMNAALAGLVILALGDSHLVYMISPLHEALEEQGAIVHSFGLCGAMPADYLSKTMAQCGAERHDKGAPIVRFQPSPTWVLGDLLERYHPNLIVIELGDNMGGYGVLPALPKDWISFEVQEMLKPIEAHHLPCVWVGPPWGSEGGASNKTFARVSDLSGYLSQIVYPCRYVDSLRFSQPGQWPTYDGEHLTPDSYRIWGADIADAAARLSAQIRSH